MIEFQRNTSDFNKKKPSVKELTHLFYLEFTKDFFIVKHLLYGGDLRISEYISIFLEFRQLSKSRDDLRLVLLVSTSQCLQCVPRNPK